MGLIYTIGRSPGNYRLFDESALWCVEVIRGLRSLGLTVAEIREVARVYLEQADEPVGPHLAERLSAARTRIDTRIGELQELRRRIDGFEAAHRPELGGQDDADFRAADRGLMPERLTLPPGADSRVLRLLAEAIMKQGIDRDQLTIHADRGTSMASKPVALLLSDLGVTKTHSRPHCSNDNPFSEAQFKTLKYRPDFPDRFGSEQDARAFCQRFFCWYNDDHRHSGIGFHTPADVHYRRAEDVRAQRAHVLTAAYAAHPERFVRMLPAPPALPEAAWINRPTEEVMSA